MPVILVILLAVVILGYSAFGKYNDYCERRTGLRAGSASISMTAEEASRRRERAMLDEAVAFDDHGIGDPPLHGITIVELPHPPARGQHDKQHI